jgi:hypothetical protein
LVAKTAVTELVPTGSEVAEATVRVAIPELRVPVPRVAEPFMKVTEPVAVRGLMVAVSNTLLPRAVPPAGMAAPFTEATSVVVVASVTLTLTAVAVLATKAVAEVGAKTAVSESVPTANVVEAMWHVPEARVHADPTAVPLLLNCTVPAGVPEEAVTVAVIVTLTPKAEVEDAAGAVMVVVVASAVAWALIMAESRNRSRIDTLPQPLRMLVDVAGAPLRVAAPGEVRISDILKPSVMNDWLSRSQRAMGIDRLRRR